MQGKTGQRKKVRLTPGKANEVLTLQEVSSKRRQAWCKDESTLRWHERAQKVAGVVPKAYAPSDGTTEARLGRRNTYLQAI